MTESMYQQIRISAADEVGEMEPKAVVAGKDTWLFVTVPEKPVAGEDVVVFFNRQQSEALRYDGLCDACRATACRATAHEHHDAQHALAVLQDSTTRVSHHHYTINTTP